MRLRESRSLGALLPVSVHAATRVNGPPAKPTVYSHELSDVYSGNDMRHLGGNGFAAA